MEAGIEIADVVGVVDPRCTVEAVRRRAVRELARETRASQAEEERKEAARWEKAEEAAHKARPGTEDAYVGDGPLEVTDVVVPCLGARLDAGEAERLECWRAGQAVLERVAKLMEHEVKLPLADQGAPEHGEDADREKTRSTRRLTLKIAKRTAVKRGGLCLSTSYENSKVMMLWECGYGHRWEASLKSLRVHGTWCPHCNQSERERLARELLEYWLGAASVKRRPRWTWTPKSKRGLEIDIYYPQHGLAVEIQGEQHCQRIAHFHPNEGDFEEQLKRDALKRECCDRAWIVLIEIWPEDELEYKLQRELWFLGVIDRQQ